MRPGRSPSSPFTIAAILVLAVCSAAMGQPADTTRAKQFLEEAKKNFGRPALADSLGTHAYLLGGTNAAIRGESAYLVCFVNSNIDFGKARQWGDSAIAWFEKADNPLWIGYTYRVLGIRATARNQNELALTLLQESSRYFERAKDTLMRVQTDINLSLLYHNNLGDFTQGLEYAKAASDKLGSLREPSPTLVWQVNNTMAINLDDLGQPEEAITWHRKNLSVENASFRATTLNNLGNTQRKMKAFADAERYFTQSLALVPASDYYMRATVFLNLAQVQEDLGRRSLALRYNDSSVYYAVRSTDIEKMRDSYEFSHRLQRRAGRLDRAYEDLHHYLDIRDSVMTKTKAEIIYGLEEKFQSAQKEQQIAQLRSETLTKDLALQKSRTGLLASLGLAALLLLGGIALFKRYQYNESMRRAKEREELQRQRFSAVIEAEENERTRVAKDLHDGLGQLISTAKLGLSAIQAPGHAPSSQLLANSIQVLDQATEEVRTIAHNLMPAALAEHGLQTVLEDMRSKVNSAGLLSMQLDLSLGEDRLPPTVEVAIYRVVQEVMNNMLKHAAADRIFVKLVRDGNSLRLSMSDNGIGFDQEAIARSKGLGWKNIFSRIALLHGDIDVKSTPGEGTIINIQFALS